MLKSRISVLALFVLLGHAAQAQQDPPARGSPSDDTSARASTPPGSFYKASDLIGFSVRNAKEEKLGDIKDLLVDMKRQCVGFAVVAYGGFLGIGDKLYAVPWNAFVLSSRDRQATIDVDKEKLKNAPGFQKDAWPAGYDEKWAGDLFTFYGTQPYWQMGDTIGKLGGAGADPLDRLKQPPLTGAQPLRLYRASNLMGLKVENPAAESLGKVEDLAIDGDRGHVLYAVLSFGGFLGMGDKYFAIPIDVFELKPDGKALVLSVAKDKLKNAPGFDQSAWPDMASPRWTTEIHKYYGQKPYWERPQGEKN
ncbi:MAG: PRC-barrel domain-containing protein [Planctomycetota bacterium]